MAPVTRRKSRTIRRLTTRQSVPKDVLVELSRNHNKECMFCGQKEISEKLYGILYQFNEIVVHYFCILLSSRAVQNGEDKDGILGFLIKDIKTELARGSRETCDYCKKKGATISCCEPRCRKIFHLPCGLMNGSMHQFYQKFKSFCSQHRMTQVVDINDLQNSNPVQCTICKDNVLPTPLPDSIWAPCCRRNAWFHRDCIQDLALSAGYFFKCPLCNNVEKFKSRMLYLGIYIPSRKNLKKIDHRDASWETVPNAFAELLERHSTCNATTCLCPHRDKRNFQQESGSWEIILCFTCGSKGTHMLCSSLKVDHEWFCNECKELTELAKNRQLEISNGNDSTTPVEITSSNATSSNPEAPRKGLIIVQIPDAPREQRIQGTSRNETSYGRLRTRRAREAIRRRLNIDEIPRNRSIINAETPRNVETPVAPVIPPPRINARVVSPTPSDDVIYVSEDSGDDSDVMITDDIRRAFEIVRYVEPPKVRYLQPVEYHYLSPAIDENYPRITAVGTVGTFSRRYVTNRCRDEPFTITANIDLTSDDNEDVNQDDSDSNNNVP